MTWKWAVYIMTVDCNMRYIIMLYIGNVIIETTIKSSYICC